MGSKAAYVAVPIDFAIIADGLLLVDIHYLIQKLTV